MEKEITKEKTNITPKETKTLHNAQKHATSQKKSKGSKKKTFFFALSLVIWIAASLIASQFLIVYLLYFTIGKEQLSTPVWTTVANALVYSLTLLLSVVVPAKIFRKKTRANWKTGREELGLRDLPTWTDLGLAPAGFIVYLILASILISIFSVFPFFDPNEAQETGYHFLNSGLDRTVAFLALCVIAPIVEEIIFRGFLYGKLRGKISGKGSMVISILITSILFGILHGQWNVGVSVFAMSIVLCGLREITGTIYAGIMLHIIKNTVAFILLYILNYQ